jgi:putative SOS response-associated peptidase YedK
MVITEPNKFVADIPDRMSVILEREHLKAWMRADDPREAVQLMKPVGKDVLQTRRCPGV